MVMFPAYPTSIVAVTAPSLESGWMNSPGKSALFGMFLERNTKPLFSPLPYYTFLFAVVKGILESYLVGIFEVRAGGEASGQAGQNDPFFVLE